MEKINKNSVLKTYRSMVLLIAGIVVGCIIGFVYGEKATVLKPLGQIFLNLMFTAVVPLVFFSLAGSVTSMTNMKRLGKILSNTLVIFILTGIIASIIIIAIVTIIPPAEGVRIELGANESPEKLNFLEQLVKAITVSDFNLILSKGHAAFDNLCGGIWILCKYGDCIQRA